MPHHTFSRAAFIRQAGYTAPFVSYHHTQCLKFFLVLAGLVGAFLLPNNVNFVAYSPTSDSLQVFDVYSMISRFGSAVFLLLQVLLLIDFAYRINDKLNNEDRQKLLLAMSVAVYVVISVGSIHIQHAGVSGASHLLLQVVR